MGDFTPLACCDGLIGDFWQFRSIEVTVECAMLYFCVVLRGDFSLIRSDCFFTSSIIALSRLTQHSRTECCGVAVFLLADRDLDLVDFCRAVWARNGDLECLASFNRLTMLWDSRCAYSASFSCCTNRSLNFWFSFASFYSFYFCFWDESLCLSCCFN